MTMGWTWEYIDNYVTLPIILEIFQSWGKIPPVHRMVASYFGIENKPPSPPPSEAELRSTIEMLKGGL